MSGFSTSFEFVFAMVLMLGVVVTVHELGHFWAAKACGVAVRSSFASSSIASPSIFTKPPSGNQASTYSVPFFDQRSR
jgi:hypothetical protein